jgi:hypothetical protein
MRWDGDGAAGPGCAEIGDVSAIASLLDPFWVGRREHMFDESCR